MKEIQVKMYEAEDGKRFETASECITYEEERFSKKYECTYRVNIVLRLDGVILKRRFSTTAKPNFDYESDFRSEAFDAIYDSDNYESAGELLGIAARQNIYPYVDFFESEEWQSFERIDKDENN